MVGTISRQQIRVFALFSLAFLMTGCAFVYSGMGQSLQALLASLSVFALTGTIIREGSQAR